MTDAHTRLFEAAEAVLLPPACKDPGSARTRLVDAEALAALRDAIAAARAEPATLRARVEKLEEALRPWANVPHRYKQYSDDHVLATWHFSFTVGDLRRARAALTDKDEANG